MTPPTVSRHGPGFVVDGLFGSPYYVRPRDARRLLQARQVAELLIPDERGNGIPAGIAYPTTDDQVRFRPGLRLDHGVYEAPLVALWRLFVGLEIFPVNLVEVRAC